MINNRLCRWLEKICKWQSFIVKMKKIHKFAIETHLLKVHDNSS